MSAVVDTFANRGETAASTPAPAVTPAAEPSAAARNAGARERPAPFQVTQPILLKRQSMLAASLLTVRAAVPPAAATFMLYASAQLYGIRFGELFNTLTVLVTVLAVFLLQPSRSTAQELLTSRGALVLSLTGRWCLLLGALLLVSSLSGLSGRYLSMYPLRVILTWGFATLPLLIVLTLGINELARCVVRMPSNRRSVVFAGCSDTGRLLAQRLSRHSELCMTVQGFFDDRSLQRVDAPSGLPLLGPLADLPAYVKRNGVDVIFIALPLRHIRRVQRLLDELGDTTVSLYHVPDVLVSDVFEARAGEMLGVPVIAMRETPFYGYRGLVKRLIDLVIASLMLVAILPLLLGIALAIKLTSPGPVIFRQRRYGLDGREIIIYKFRTMRALEDNGWLKQAGRDDERVTAVGRTLRRWSLDELPQLINVLQGRMSLVGPRPHAIGHNEEYRRLIKGYMMRHKVPPGITGLAQIKGWRGETRQLNDMRRRVQCDLEYVCNWSPWLDLKILALTLPVLFRSDRAY